MSISIYSPKVLAYARTHGVTDLQAYRAVNAQAQIARMPRTALTGHYKSADAAAPVPTSFLDKMIARITAAFDKNSDWRYY